LIRLARATLSAAAALLAALPAIAAAQDTTSRGVRIGLTYDPGTKPGVLILPVTGRNGDSLTAIVRRDLDYGDRVTVIDGASVGVTSATRMDYDVVAKLGGLGVVQATVTATGLHVALHDVGQRRVVSVQDFALPAGALDDDWRLAVHGVSDEIERWITGTRGIAATRILYVHDRRLWMVDSDGANPRPVTDRGSVLSPAWHPDGKHVAYSAFANAGTQIAIRNLGTGTSRWLAATPGGLNITPTFSPDGNTLLWAHGEESGTDLFAAPAFGSGGARRVTVGRGSDNVSPSFSPDGRRVAFTSGRSGHPEVYITDVDGTNAELLTPYNFGDQSYRSNPDWSPDGRTIAFQSQIAGRFQVMTISLRDRRIRQLTSEGANEDPSWAPDGRHLVFSSTRTGARQLYVVDVESGRVRQLTRAPGARLAAWSPRLGGAR
jgi:TolB protein